MESLAPTVILLLFISCSICICCSCCKNCCGDCSGLGNIFNCGDCSGLGNIFGGIKSPF